MQLITFLQSDTNIDTTAQACIEVMANLPQNINLAFINALMNEPTLQSLTKLIIYKVLLQQHSFNLIAYIDLKTLGFALTTNQESLENLQPTLDKNFLVSSQTKNTDVINTFKHLCNAGLINSPLMSLFLLSLSWEQVNVVGNYASNTLTVDQTMQVLLQSNFAKLIPLASTSLNKVEDPSAIIALIRRLLGDKLDLLVSFETQLQAWQGDELSCSEFKRQLQANWPKFEGELSSSRLIAGKALNTKLNAIEISAMDSYSQAVFNLYSYYQHVTTKQLTAEAVL
ncbi:hypothetical protein [Pseudoalteromonas carrageenovora]|uniref:hypothetical protein n=1 Tax=Pseudoalteromonas carrageenovora TaxID=227 RepID=UPI001FC91137|nr:hypothetical protein [Pseudoalteromonas carrageenovora]